MTENQIPLLVPETAKKAHSELLSALGTEANPAQWMEFMEAVTRLLPAVLSVGRPTAEAINRSPIGQLGFRSWQAMIEAPTHANGLGWNIHSWKAWRRAWVAVQAYPWLRTQPMTANEVSTLVADVKREGMPFPQSAEEARQIQELMRAASEARRANTAQAIQQQLTAAQFAVTDLQQQLAAANARASMLAEQLTAAQALAQTRADELTAQVGKQAAQIDELKRQLAEARKPQPQPTPLTRWEHLLAFLGR